MTGLAISSFCVVAGCHHTHTQGLCSTHSSTTSSMGVMPAAGKLDMTPRCMNPAVSNSNTHPGGSVDSTQVRVMVPFNDMDRAIPAVQRALSIQQQHHINGENEGSISGSMILIVRMGS